ncbi:LOW QUALITY PROTEIN: putative claudin-24 [Salvelinus alpinus]
MVLLTAKIMARTALFVTVGGLVTTLVTTFIPLWKTLNSDLNAENWYSGLWHTCIFTEEVGIAFESLMALSVDLLASMVLMLVSGTRALAMVVAFPGLEGVELGSGRQQGLKRGLLIVSGVLSWVSGLTTLVVSLVAYVTVVEFWDENLPDVVPCWEFGEAMFSGWFPGLFLVIGGSLFFVVLYMADHNRQQRVASLPNTPQEKPRGQYYLKTVYGNGGIDCHLLVIALRRYSCGDVEELRSTMAGLDLHLHVLIPPFQRCRRYLPTQQPNPRI